MDVTVVGGVKETCLDMQLILSLLMAKKSGDGQRTHGYFRI